MFVCVCLYMCMHAYAHVCGWHAAGFHLIKRSKRVLKGSLRPGRAPCIVCLVHSETALIPTGRLRTLVQNMAAEVNFLRQIGNEHTFQVMRHMINHSLQEVPGLRSYMNTSYTYVLKIFLICVCTRVCRCP